MPVQYFRSGVFHHKVGKLRNMRHMLAKLVPNGRTPGHARHFEIWMGREDTESLAPAYPVAPATATVYLAIVTSLFIDSLKTHSAYTLCTILHNYAFVSCRIVVIA